MYGENYNRHVYPLLRNRLYFESETADPETLRGCEDANGVSSTQRHTRLLIIFTHLDNKIQHMNTIVVFLQLEESEKRASGWRKCHKVRPERRLPWWTGYCDCLLAYRLLGCPPGSGRVLGRVLGSGRARHVLLPGGLLPRPRPEDGPGVPVPEPQSRPPPAAAGGEPSRCSRRR